ncbi:cyclodeaminase/cyclohydrolase family protein [Bacillaceae bacterium Marseille-Q3522]|nr:cyclodeaminase/cyclohydrolase family protein [Bacillaceae bacterium Marseille-Q3522]
MNIYSQKIETFLQEAASDSPVPGGGSVAALAAGLGAAMGAMVANLTKGAKFAAVEEDMRGTVLQMNQLIAQSGKLLEEDMQIFTAFMDAIKSPKATEEEKAIRKERLQQAAIQATETPLQLLRLCNDGLESIAKIVVDANKNVISDLGVSAFLFEAAAQSAVLTMEINLPMIGDQKQMLAYQTGAQELIEKVSALKEKVVQTVRERIGS